MPYRDLTAMAVERYASVDDLDRLGVTIEEREEYEHLVEVGAIVMAGVDYEAILREAEKEADVIVWDGGNNDWPFYKSDLEIVALDPHRPGHERAYFPGEVNFLRADVLVINKVNTAEKDAVDDLIAAAATYNPNASARAHLDSEITASDPAALAGKRVLAVEDGPTVTHGGMRYGAAAIAAKRGRRRRARQRRTVRGGLARRHLRGVPAHGPRAAGDGLLGGSSSRTSRRPSRRPMPTSSRSARRSTSRASSRSTSRSCGSPTASSTPARRAWTASSTSSASVTAWADARV